MHADIHEACKDATHPCFRCKMVIWRTEGMTAIAPLPEGWGDRTIAQTVREIKQGAKENGIPEERIQPVGTRWV